MKSNFKILGLLLVVFVFLSSCKKEEIDSQKSNSTNKGVYANGSTVSNEFSSSSNTNTFTNNGFSNNFSTGLSSNTFTTNNNSSNTIDLMCIVGTWKSPKTNPESECPQDYHLKLVFYSSGNGVAFHLDEYLCINDMTKYFNWSLSEEGNLKITYNDGSVSETNFYCTDNLNIYWNGNNLKTLSR